VVAIVSKRVILRCDGSLESGFGVILEIRDTAELMLQTNSVETLTQSSIFTEAVGSLPPAMDLIQLLASWQEHYLGSLGVARISLESISTNIGTLSEIAQCRQLSKELQQSLTRWLASGSFQPIEQRLRETLTVQDSVEVLLRSNDERLHKLPWHLWDFIERYPQAELLIGSRPESIIQTRQSHHPVRILAISGDSQGIDIEADRQLLAALPLAEVVFLVEPSRQELYRYLWEKPWDVLFFAGHSNTEQYQGRIHLSTEESLTIDELRYALRRAIDAGLQLAIFNSCDGLGLAYELEQLHIPQSIVMREPVPDRVALTFLKQFLSSFSGGTTLHGSVRQAREYLQSLEGEFPCASWLPVIFQNPAVQPLTWQNLQGDAIIQPPTAPIKQSEIRKKLALWAAFSALVVTGLTTGVRYFGLLQPWELKAFDTLMQLRSAEKPDPRLLIVTITEADVEAQKKSQETSRGSLSDKSLAKIIDKLEIHQPVAIGLDIYHDFPVDKAYPTLVAKLKNQDSSIIGICKVSEQQSGDNGVKPPPDISLNKIGFNDVIQDADLVVRRHLLSFTPPAGDPCQVNYALSVKLALRYLATKNINLKFTPQEDWKLGQLTISLLDPHSGGYQKINGLGHQILLNYRATPTLNDLATTVTMADVLADKLRPEQVKDRIVLIGTTAHSFHDYILTPYTAGEGNTKSISGVMLHAQMVSQLLGAALDGRLLLRSWHTFQDSLWILAWAIIGGILVIWIRHPFYLALGTGIILIILPGVCLILLQTGYWVPLIPSAISIIGTVCIVVLISATSQEKNKISSRTNL
jgi:CHASE2 domain-containing sensor protein